MSASNDNILVYRLGSLGDTIMALPCFHKVREAFPSADITLLTNQPVMAKASPSEAVLGSGYFYNRVLTYPVGTRNPFLLATLAWQIKTLNIHTVVNLTMARSESSVQRDRWFFRASGVRHLIGFPTGQQDFDIINPTTGEPEWEARRLARRLNAIGSPSLDADHYWDLRLTDAERSTARQVLGDRSSQVPMIALCVGTKLQSNDWGEVNWINLATRLRSVLSGWKLVMIGAADEADLSNRIADAWGGASLNLCGRTSPRVSAAVLEQTRVFVGHDSGPMHLAACVGTPCVGIFSARNLPRQWYPRGDKNRILYHKTDCAGCRLEVCIDQRKKCILSISVHEVEQAVLDLINIEIVTPRVRA